MIAGVIGSVIGGVIGGVIGLGLDPVSYISRLCNQGVGRDGQLKQTSLLATY